MKHILSLAIAMLLGSSAFADTLVAPIRIQTAQVLGESGTPTSCRLYRKRIQQFLQRENEAATAAAISEDRLNPNEIRRVLDILQRADVPLDIKKENILWTLDFDTTATLAFFDQGPVMVEINSTYLQWQTDQGLFPDHFRVDMSSDLTTARVTYKMNYMEACLAPVTVAVKLTNGLGNAVFMQAMLNRNLL